MKPPFSFNRGNMSYVILVIAVIGLVIIVPTFQNIQFNKIIDQLDKISQLYIEVAQISIHNHEVIIHNQQVITHNQEVIVNAIDKHDANVSMLKELRNDTRTDFQSFNVTDRESEELESESH